MHREQTVDPRRIYDQWDRLQSALDPATNVPSRGSDGAVEATISLLSARQPVWAVLSLAAGFASQTDQDVIQFVADLASTDPHEWPSESPAVQFTERYNRLEWEPAQLVASAHMLVWSVPATLLTLAANTVVDFDICRQLYDDPADVEKCIREAAKLGGASPEQRSEPAGTA